MGKVKIDNPQRDPDFKTGVFSDGILIDGFYLLVDRLLLILSLQSLC